MFWPRTLVALFFSLTVSLAFSQTCSIVINPSKVCRGNTATVSVTSSQTAIASVAIYYGDGNSNLNASLLSAYSYQVAGKFIPRVKIFFTNGDSCEALGDTVTVFHLPVANYTITSADTMCFNRNNLCIVDRSTPGLSGAPLNQLVWQLSNGYFLNTTPQFNQTLCYANALDVNGHLYTSVVEVRDTNNCLSRLEKKDSVLLYPKLDVSLTSTIYPYCDSTVVVLTNTSQTAFSRVRSFKWLYTDGAVDSLNWLQSKHKFIIGNANTAQLVVTDTNGCSVGFTDTGRVVVNSIADSIIITTPIAQCYQNNEYELNTFGGESVVWRVYNSAGERVDSSYYWLWMKPGFKAPNCGPYRVELAKTLLNCKIIKDTFIHVLGPKAIIEQDTNKVINSHQCSIQDTVYFKTPVPYLSCHHNNPAMTRLWDFGDAYAPPCTTDTKNGINIGLNCNWSKDSMLVKHMYSPGREGCYEVKLMMEDLATGCKHQDSMFVPLTKPASGYDSTYNPPRPRLQLITPPEPCMYELLEFDISRTLPGCQFDKAWINFDSTCGQHLWVELDTITKDRKRFYRYDFTCDTSGWVTVGLIIKNGNCYDTTWYHRFLRLYPKKPIYGYHRNNSCTPFDITLFCMDSFQQNLTKSQWSIGAFSYRDTFNTGLLIYGYRTPLSIFIDNPIAANDSTIPSVRLNQLPRHGIYGITHTLYDINDCYGYADGYIAMGYHKYMKRSKAVVCVNDTLSLHQFVKYYDLSGPDFLNPRDYWSEPARAAAELERIWWDIGDGSGVSITGPNPVIKYTKPGNYTITMITADSTGCTDTIVYRNIIHVVEPVAVIRSMDDHYFCAPQIIQFHDSSYVIDSSLALMKPRFDSITNWNWVFDDNKPNSLQQNPAHQFTSNGVFKVQLIATSALGCRDTVTHAIQLKGPQPSFDILTDTIGCEPYTVIFDNTTSKKLLNWIWFYGDGVVEPISDSVNTIHTYTNPGVYKVKLQGIDTVFNTTTQSFITCNAYFPDSATGIPSRTIYVLPRAKASVIAADTICPNTEVLFQVQADTILKHFFWQWSVADTLTIHRPTLNLVKRFSTPGNYAYMMAPYADTALTCVDTVYRTLFVSDVKADFEIAQMEAATYKFMNKSTNASSFRWDFGDVSSGTNNYTTQKDPEHTYGVGSMLDTFWVCLVAINAQHCEDTICKPVVLGARVKIPNVFTPDNGDGLNDAFDIDILGWLSYRINIYNRWGNEVFTGNKDGVGNDGINWNGKRYNTGEQCPAGVYYFIFTYQLITDAEPVTVHGTITLIRE